MIDTDGQGNASNYVLISTYWNVNIDFSRFLKLKANSFNLNLLECKCFKTKAGGFLMSSFNLNLLECKSARTVTIWKRMFVLISTYWNVNYNYPRQSRPLQGFNLNLLECK